MACIMGPQDGPPPPPVLGAFHYSQAYSKEDLVLGGGPTAAAAACAARRFWRGSVAMCKGKALLGGHSHRDLLTPQSFMRGVDLNASDCENQCVGNVFFRGTFNTNLPI